jgi:hypothetical protein
MTPFRTAALVLVLSAGTTAAQPKGGDVQPNRIAIGTVYTGATVEASFMLFEPGTDPKLALKVTAPKFVKILRTAVRTQEFGKGNHFVCGTVEIAIDTKAAAEWRGEVSVTLGNATAKVPVTATMKKRRPGLVRLLVGQTPFEAHSTRDGKAFEGWTELMNKAGLDPHYLLTSKDRTVFRDLDLSKFDCILLCDGSLVFLTPADVKKVRAFAERGGRVVVAANRFMRGSVAKANDVLAGYGLQMRDEESQLPGTKGVTVGKADLDPKVAGAGVVSLDFFRASPVAITDSKVARALVKAKGVVQPGDAFVAVAKAGRGQVVVLGQSMCWYWVSETRAGKADNAKLLGWLLAPPQKPEEPSPGRIP